MADEKEIMSASGVTGWLAVLPDMVRRPRLLSD
jgi:hypothetical protein